MTNTLTPRHAQTYRQDEIRLICNYAQRGHSLCLMGIAGTGKSNIVKFLVDNHEDKQQYLDSDVERVHFPVVDANTWQGTALNLWELMLSALIRTTSALPPAPPAEIIQLDKEERTLANLRAQLAWVCQTQGHQVMFILDDFDRVFENAPLAMLEQLNAFRSEGNRESLSYLIFTKRLPHVLARHHNLEQNSKFYDLFRHDIYALGMYTLEETRQMLRHLNELAGHPLERAALLQIQSLSGGHARLARILFDSWVRQAPPPDAVEAFFASNADVQQECRRIFLSLHRDEQAVARRFARFERQDEDVEILDHLVRRGLIVSIDPPEWFSSLLPIFLRSAVEEEET